VSRHETYCREDPPRRKPAGYDKYIESCRDVSLLISDLNAEGLVRNALSNIMSWHYSKGNQNCDAQLNIWMNKSFRPLFTVSVHNRLLFLLRKNHNQVVLIQCNLIDSAGNITTEKVDD